MFSDILILLVSLLQRIAETAPVVPFLSARLSDARKVPVSGAIPLLIVNSVDDFVSQASVPAGVFALQ